MKYLLNLNQSKSLITKNQRCIFLLNSEIVITKINIYKF